jgi:hypothetical protein
MKFPINELNIDEYFKEIVAVLDAEDSKIFLDTNILAKYYAFHNIARAELNQWLRDLALKKKLKIPGWVLNEYSKHYIRQRTEEYLGDGNLISNIEEQFIKFKKFLPMYIEQDELSRYGYATHQDLRDEMNEMQKKFQIFKKMKGNKKEHSIKMNQEITDLLKDCILDTDIFQLAEKVGRSAPLRYTNQLPPGFEDGEKGGNSAGDLILWTEILEYCKNNSIKKVILITNDNKRDWVYAPQKIKIGGRIKPNPQPNFKLIDTRLSFEFKLATASEEIYIITLSTLTQALLQSGNQEFFQLAAALQIEHEEEQQSKHTDNNISDTEDVFDTDSFGSNQKNDAESDRENAMSDESAESAIESIPSYNSEPIREYEILQQYSADALADHSFKQFTNQNLAELVDEFKSYNWYRQNPAVAILDSLDDSDLKATPETKNELFVIGRNVYQAACGGAWNAYSYVEELAGRKSKTKSFIHEHIINGMMFEIYFDSIGNFRGDSFKVGLIDIMFDFKVSDDFNPYKFINEVINLHMSSLIIKPNDANTKITFIINGETKETETEGIFGPRGIINSVVENSIQLLHGGYGNHSIAEFIDIKDIQRIIQRKFAVPLNLISIEIEENLKDATFFNFANGYILKKGELPPLPNSENTLDF